MQSRQAKRLTVYFPEITAAVREQISAGKVLYGELVIYWDGRCDFTALPYRKRRKRLRHLLVTAGPPLALMPATRGLVGARAATGSPVPPGDGALD